MKDMHKLQYEIQKSGLQKSAENQINGMPYWEPVYCIEISFKGYNFVLMIQRVRIDKKEAPCKV